MVIKFLILIFFVLNLSTVNAKGMKSFKKYILSPQQKYLDKIYKMNPKYILRVIKALNKSKAIHRSEKKLLNTKKLLEGIEENIDDDDLLDAVENLNAKIALSLEKIKKEKKSYSFFAVGAFNSWQDSFTLNYSTSSEEQKSMNRGPCVGGGLDYGNAIWRYSLELCFGGFGTFSNTFYETGVGMMYLSSSFDWRYFLSDKASIGVGVPIIWRSTDFALPPTATSIEGTSYFNFGLNLKYYFDLSKRIQYYTGIGGILSSGALLWANGIRFYF